MCVMIVIPFSQLAKHVQERYASHARYHTTFTKDSAYQHVKMGLMILGTLLVLIVFLLV